MTASSTGYTLPVVVIAEGASVVFTSSDIGHVTIDGAPGVLKAPNCVDDTESKGVLSPPIVFSIAGGTLRATQKGVTLTCVNAQALPDGSFALPFLCRLHGNMRGLLVVEP